MWKGTDEWGLWHERQFINNLGAWREPKVRSSRVRRKILLHNYLYSLRWRVDWTREFREKVREIVLEELQR